MDLSRYLEKKEWTYTHFAKKCNVAPATIKRALKGLEVSLTSGIKIQRGSSGAVTCLDLYRALKKNKT
jgi:hypothetical protein